jgi:ketosteroid isomerase-like protein
MVAYHRRMDYTRLIKRLYSAFNDRDIDVLVAQMTEDVDWPNAWEGGRAHGHDGVRDYWTRQWAAIDPTVEPGAVTTRPDGKVAVGVRQRVRSLDGTLLGEGDVVHVYSFRGELIARMDVEDAEGRPAEQPRLG